MKPLRVTSSDSQQPRWTLTPAACSVDPGEAACAAGPPPGVVLRGLVLATEIDGSGFMAHHWPTEVAMGQHYQFYGF